MSVGKDRIKGASSETSSAYGGTTDHCLRPVLNSDGSVHVPSFLLPFSAYASTEARKELMRRGVAPAAQLGEAQSIEDARAAFDLHFVAPNLERQKAKYHTIMSEKFIGGVFTQVFAPVDGVSARNERRLLINLHGGGFMHGSRSMSQVESIPISAIGRIRVVSIDYRMAPEFEFPAASEDVAAVYRELLQTYKPADIAIYGCSAGGTLAAQSAAWFEKVGLPQPAALALLSASADRGEGWTAPGDSAWITPWLGSAIPIPSEGLPGEASASYFRGAAKDDVYAAPIRSSSLLAKFPPTIFLTGTRGSETSAATRSHIELLKAGVDARLVLWDGLDHGFMINPDLPESRELYEVMLDFFGSKMDYANLR